MVMKVSHSTIETLAQGIAADMLDQMPEQGGDQIAEQGATEPTTEQIRAAQRAYRQMHPPKPETERQRQKRIERQRRWREAHREQLREYHRQWAADHREQRRETMRRFWQRKAAELAAATNTTGEVE